MVAFVACDIDESQIMSGKSTVTVMRKEGRKDASESVLLLETRIVFQAITMTYRPYCGQSKALIIH